MNDVVLVALISSGSTLAAAVLTNWLALIRANRQADRSERQATVHWERTEARRRDEAHAAEQRRLQARQARDLQQFWDHVRQAQQRMHALLGQWEAGCRDDLPTTVHKMPVDCALQAYSVALRSLPAVYPATHRWFLAVVHLDSVVRYGDAVKIEAAHKEETQAFHHLLKTVGGLSGALPAAERAAPADSL